MIKTILIAAGAVATAATGYAALSGLAPDTAARIESLVRDRGLGWDEAACQGNPAGCLNNRFERLQILEREVETSMTGIRAELERVTRLVADQEELVGKNLMFLDQGKTLLRQRQSQPDQSVLFAGRTYPSLSTFRAQLQLLFEEKTALEASVSSARELRAQLQARLDTLMVQAGQITLAKRVLPAQLQLIRANKALGEFNINVTLIDSVIRGSEVGLSQSRQLIRTTRDLAAPTTPLGRDGASQDAFENYLRN